MCGALRALPRDVAVKYFFDNPISAKYAHMLAALEVDAVALRDEFPADMDDVTLLGKPRGREVVFVTADRRIRRRQSEARALRECGVTALFFGPFWAKMGFWQQAAWLVAKWPLLDGFARGAARGTCAEVKQNGKSDVLAS
jgi:hypothetical protein